MKNFNHIPGMIEPVEQEMLQAITSSIEFGQNDTLIEYGSFFGRSTNCIIEGLKNNKSYSPSNNLIIYDSFKCKSNGSFASHVNTFAQKGKVENLIEKKQSIISFRKIFEHYCLPSPINIHINECEISEINAIQNPISFMHIDCPKYYSEFKFIIDKHFLSLKKGSIIVFQDFFYHWSATLIASIELLLQGKFIEIQRTAASSLTVEVKKKIKYEDIKLLDHKMNTISLIELIDSSINRILNLENTKIDRIHQFLPRLILASIQYSWELGQFQNAEYLWRSFLINYPEKLQPVFDDFHELMRYGFSVRALYEIDHDINL